MSKFQMVGTVVAIAATKVVSESFKKREFVVKTDDAEYPQTILFEFTQDKCSILDQVPVNSRVSVSFNLRGRRYERETDGAVFFFNTLQAWKIEPVNAVPAATPPTNTGFGAQAPAQGFGAPAPATVPQAPTQAQGFGAPTNAGFGAPSPAATPQAPAQGFGAPAQPQTNAGFGISPGAPF